MPEPLQRFRRGVGRMGLIGLAGGGAGVLAMAQSHEANWAWAVGMIGAAVVAASNVLASWMRSRESRDSLLRRVEALEAEVKRLGGTA